METDRLTPQEALARVPGWDARSARVREITSGLTNRTYRVQHRGNSYALRLDAPHTAAFGLDRQTELAILHRAAEAGLAPAVVFAEPGLLLTEWLPGAAWSAEDLARPGSLDTLAALLHEVHNLPRSGVQFDARRIAETYSSGLRGEEHLAAMVSRCLQVACETSARVLCCCHNDIVAGNVIATPTLKLIDWEYACDNNPLFDLASLIGFHDLDSRSSQALLSAYDGGTDRLPELQAMIRRYDALQWLWLANRNLISPAAGQRERLQVLQARIS